MPDPSIASIVAHDASCPYCATALPGDPRCMERVELVAAWRQSLRSGTDSSEEGDGDG
jgi:dihydropteroate synthase